jgi:AacA4 family aminoglycoside N(6')-acetyltransferase
MTSTETDAGDPSAIVLRLMTSGDLSMLHDWLNRPHIVEWWGGEGERPSMRDVVARYAPQVMAEHNVTPYIALLNDEPFAYAQSYVALGAGGGWWEEITDPGVRGIDQSIAEPDKLGRGYGTRLVRTLVDRLFTDPAVTRVQTDPAPGNARAIRCYQKAGFRVVSEIMTPDDPALYMIRERELRLTPR